MLRKLFYLALVFCCVPFAHSQNTQLTGSLVAPDGSKFNGFLYLKLLQPAAAQTVNSTCVAAGAPVQVIPQQIIIQVVNGTLINPPKVWGADCLLPYGIPYNVTERDVNGNVVVRDQWLIQDPTFDVGTAVSTNIQDVLTHIGPQGPPGLGNIALDDSTLMQYTHALMSNVTGSQTMAGPLLLNADPTSALMAATKEYVDNTASSDANSATSALNNTLSSAIALNSNQNAIESNMATGTGATMVGSGGGFGADNGETEKYFFDFHTIVKDATTGDYEFPGFDSETDGYSQNGHWNCKACTGAPAYLVRSMTFGPPAFGGDTSFSIAGQLLYNANSGNNCIGFSSAPMGQASTQDSQRFRVCASAGQNGFYVQDGGTLNQMPSVSSYGYGWYDVFLGYDGNNIYFSANKFGANEAVTNYFPGMAVPSGIANVELSSINANDEQQWVRYSAGGPYQNVLNTAFSDQTYNPQIVINDATAGGIWVILPHNYRPGMANRWVIYEHGYNEVGWSVSGLPGSGGNTGVNNVALALVQAGYVVVGVENTVQNCYGNSQCMTDLANVYADVTGKFSLAPQPYMFAESMGGFAMFNSIARGVIHPRAVAAMCANTNLSWDYYSGGAQAPINSDYNISSSNPYGTATAGYDPEIASGATLTNLVKVPTIMWASPSDTIVLKSQNTDMYSSMINNNGGSVTVIQSSGQHEDLSNFDGAAVVNFFNSH